MAGCWGGIFAGALYVRKKGFALPEWADLLAPAIPLFHFFGRIGCFLGGCCYGVPCSFGFTYTHNLIEQANGVSRFSIQLVEAAFNLALFFLLWTLQKKGKFQGKRLVLYLLGYSVGRFVFEFGRGDTYRGIWFGLSTSQYISVGLFLVAVVFLLYQRFTGRATQKL